MPKLIATHEVNDVAHWLASPEREKLLSAVASNIQTFVDPEKSNLVGVSMDVPDMEAFQAVLGTDAAAAAMKHDGVRPETMKLLVES